MQFLIRAYDGPDMLARRMEVRPRHLEGMKKLGAHVVCAGGLLDDEGKMKGSALVVDFEDRAALDAYLADEPYVAEHVWEKIEVEPLNVVIVDGAVR
ncbi:MAG: YciI family protein [Oscillospiraceae bacterium]|nr:YciI family protein [Oscillospiraceae bacterium]